MPNITQLATVTSISSETTFVVINNGATRRYSYQNLHDKLISDGAVGYTGSAGTGYTGSRGNTGYTGSAGTGGGGGYSRTLAYGVTQNIYPNDIGNITFDGFKSYALMSIYTAAPAWVRLYTTSAARTSDSTRDQLTDPTPGSGVIAEVITSASTTVTMTPSVIGFNNDQPPSTTIYGAVKNLSVGQQSITVVLTLLQLET